MALRRHLDDVRADVVITTEDDLSVWDRYPHAVDAGPDWGYPIRDGRRKVIAWSTAPWTDVRTIDQGAPAGRLVAAKTTIGDVKATVVAVCIPWSGAHVSSGRRDRSRWDEHIAFCAALEELLRTLTGSVVIAGDFNQAVPQRRQPRRAYDALMQALDGYEIASAGTTAAGQLIDHIAISDDFRATAVQAWPNVIDGVRLSDHTGVAIYLERQSR